MTELNFTWYVLSFTEKELNIQIIFNNPLQISPNAKQDYIVVYFKQISPFFISLDKKGELGKDYITLKKKIRKQMPVSDEKYGL